MSRYLYTFVMVAGLLYGNLAIHGEEYTTKRLARIAEILQKKTVSWDIVRRTNTFGEVDHIGLRLFTAQMRHLSPSPTYDFLERSLLELNLIREADNGVLRLRDELVFTTGNAATALAVDTTYDYSVDKIDYYRYRSTWTKGGNTVLQIVYNMNWQLISGCSISELEQIFEKNLLRHVVVSVDTLPVRGTYIISPQFNNSLYLDTSSPHSSPSSVRPYVFTPKQLSRSVRNLMLAEDLPVDVMLRMRVNRYDFITDTLDVSLRQFLNYCRVEEGCTPYFGLKNHSEGAMEGVLLLANNSAGFLHMLTVMVDEDVIARGKGIVHCRLMPYIPLHNVKKEYLNLTEYETIE